MSPRHPRPIPSFCRLRALALAVALGLAAAAGAGCASGIAGPEQPEVADPGDTTQPTFTPLPPSSPSSPSGPAADDPSPPQVAPPPVTGGSDPPDGGGFPLGGGGTMTPDEPAPPPPPPPPPPQTSTVLTASCPGQVTVDRFERTTLSGGVVAGVAARFQWEVLTRPSGSQAQPEPAEAPVTDFRPDRDGDYLLRLTAFDDAGQSSACDVALHARFRGIRALVEWNPGAFTVEMHMIDPLATVWFDGRDCFPGGCNANWGDSDDALDNPAILVNLSGSDLFNFIEVPRVDARAGDVYTVGLFVRAVLDGVVNNASGQIAVQCGEDEPVGATFQNLGEGLFLKAFDLVMRANGGCDVNLLGGTFSEEQVRQAR